MRPPFAPERVNASPPRLSRASLAAGRFLTPLPSSARLVGRPGSDAPLALRADNGRLPVPTVRRVPSPLRYANGSMRDPKRPQTERVSKRIRKHKQPTVDKRAFKRYIVGMAKRATSSNKPKAIGYVRVSTGRQADKGGSLAVQRDRIVEYAVLGGFDLVTVFEDRGVSGVKDEGERAGFRAALDAIRSGEAEVLLVTDADRFSRDADVAGHARIEVRRAGGRVTVISEAGANVEMVAVRQLLAVLEREKIRARMRTWSAARVKSGLHMGPRPFGFRVAENGRLEAEPKEFPVVEKILSLRKAGASLRSVAETLTAKGIASPTGGTWGAMTVLKIERRAAK